MKHGPLSLDRGPVQQIASREVFGGLLPKAGGQVVFSEFAARAQVSWLRDSQGLNPERKRGFVFEGQT